MNTEDRLKEIRAALETFCTCGHIFCRSCGGVQNHSIKVKEDVPFLLNLIETQQRIIRVQHEALEKYADPNEYRGLALARRDAFVQLTIQLARSALDQVEKIAEGSE